MTQPLVECEGLVHIYKTDELEVVALQGLDLRVEAGDERRRGPRGRA